MHIFSPYEKQNSALTDGIKLLKSNFKGEKSILIYGYDYADYPVEKTINLFEKATRIHLVNQYKLVLVLEVQEVKI